MEIARAEQVEATQPSNPLEVELRTSDFRGLTLTHAVREGLAIFEGDIVLGAAADLTPASTKARENQSLGVSDERYRWPGGVLPFLIDPGLPDVYRIQQAVTHWNTQLGGAIRLVPRTNEPNYVLFRRPFNPGTCQSFIGLQGSGAQITDIGDYCTTGNVIHEIGHSIGLWHEQGPQIETATCKSCSRTSFQGRARISFRPRRTALTWEHTISAPSCTTRRTLFLRTDSLPS